MSADAAIQSTMALAQSAAPKAPTSAKTLAAATKAAKEYEGVFISEFMGSMFSGISTDGPFGVLSFVPMEGEYSLCPMPFAGR